jgi:GntR family transcriptional regulator, transcriptional repressor for pyruvate dehydrogenase complex
MFEKITPTLRSRLVVEQIISWLKNRDVSVGDKLAPERELAVAMNVSRNTLREAIAILQLAGILEVKQGSGIFVASIPSEAEVDSWMSGIGPQGQIDPETAIDARIALEPGIAILASKVSEATDWEKFENCIQEMEGARRAGDIDRYRRNDNHLHRAIALATHNQFIAATIPGCATQPATQIHEHGPALRGAPRSRRLKKCAKDSGHYQNFCPRAPSTYGQFPPRRLSLCVKVGS